MVNPGIEALGSRWDAHLNAYFPMGDRHYTAGTIMIPFFTGHSQLDKMFLSHQYAGSGADIKAAYQLFPNSSLKGYVGSYYFSPAETNNVWGGAAGLEYWLTQGVKLVGSYTYDNLHQSTYALGLGLEWGGTRVHRSDPELEERLTDPIDRNLAELGRGSTIPTRLKTKPMMAGSTEITLLLLNNMAFFSQTGGPNNGGVGLTLANCTFENPCGPTDFSQASVNTLAGLLPNTQLYFNGGTYTTSSPINLVPGQALRSRTADYSQPATDTARSTILSGGTIGLQGNNILENMILSSRINFPIGVNITGSNNTITGSQIGLTGSPPSVGINDSSSNNTRIDNSSIEATDVVINGNASSNITIQNSELDIFFNSSVMGASFSNGSTASIINTTINVGSVDAATPIGVIANSGSSVGIINSSISMNSGFPTVIGLQANGSGSLITMMGGTIQLAQRNSQISSSNSGGSVIFQGGTICTIANNGVSCS